MTLGTRPFPKWQRGAVAFLLISGPMLVPPAIAQSESQVESQAASPDLAEAVEAADRANLADLAQIKTEIAALKADYESRIAALEERLSDVEAGQTEAVSSVSPVSPLSSTDASEELAFLRDAARQAAAELTEPGTPSPPPIGSAMGKGSLNRLNPEISFTGISLGIASSDDREEFSVEEFELDLQSALDPFSRTRVTLAVGDEGVDLEEIYVNYSGLPGGLDLLVGKFRQRFGPLNRQHLHALPQSEYPLVYQAIFGDEGLGQTGLSFTWLLPKPWATANEITFEVTDGENEEAFGGESFDDFSVLGRLKNFWEISDSTYFEWGLSGIAGKTATDGDSRVYGTDLTLSWQPPGKTKYRGLSWRTEVLRSEREDEFGVTREALGGYTYLERLFRRNLYGGVRLDRAESPLDPASYTTGIVPYLTWWQSEYVRLRAEYGLFELKPSGATEDRFSLQLTWAAGPHKHESY